MTLRSPLLPRPLAALLIAPLAVALLSACTDEEVPPLVDASLDATTDQGVVDQSAAEVGGDLQSSTCTFVNAGVGGQVGKTKLTVETVVSGLEIPWSLAFPAKDDILVTEMSGRLRLVRSGKLLASPVLTLPTPQPAKTTGQGLQGVVLHPSFNTNRKLYLHYTIDKGGGNVVNRVARYTLSVDSTSAVLDKVILDDIPAGFFHNGGRMRFGADGMLYITTGDANQGANSQNKGSLAGKLLRVTDDGKVPSDNPWPNNPAAIVGIRNSQGFDFAGDGSIYLVDHGPSGEMGQTGQDEVTLAKLGDNMGWPKITGCGAASGMLQPSLSWKDAVPPGAVVLYQGTAIPGWKGSLVMTSLGAKTLVRISIDPKNPRKVTGHETYLTGDTSVAHGRLRAIEVGPDGQLYVTTSNCDDHGACDPPKDRILRIKSP